MPKLTFKITETLHILFREAAASAGLSRTQIMRAMIQAYTKGRINIVDVAEGELKREVIMRLDGEKPTKPQLKATGGNKQSDLGTPKKPTRGEVLILKQNREGKP